MTRLSAVVAVLALSAACTAPQSHEGTTIYVKPGIGGEWDDGEHRGARGAIQDAIDAATTNNIVDVASGTFFEDLVLKDGVDVRGAGMGETILVGTITGGTATATVSRFTMYDPTWEATGTAFVNDGITSNGGYVGVVEMELFYFNNAVHGIANSETWVDRSVLAGNWYAINNHDNGIGRVQSSLIVNNAAGGTVSYAGSWLDVVNNTLVGNGFGGTSLYLSGAIAQGDSGGVPNWVTNNVIVGNYYGVNCGACDTSFRNNGIWGNTTDYENDAEADASDVAIDPQLENVNEGDYHLKPSSGMIDTGSMTLAHADTDFDGEARPQGITVDIGFDEYASSAINLQITEVMANARVEKEDEFVEIYNAGTGAVDLAGLVLTDGDDIDVLQALAVSPTATLLPPGEYAVVLDPGYTGRYDSLLPSGTILLTTGDTTIGNGLTTSDKVRLYETDGSTLIAGFTFPKDPGDNKSMEMFDLATGDAAGNWRPSRCTDTASDSSPGAAHCFPPSGLVTGLIITEVLANASVEATGEFVELYNPTDLEIDASSLWIDDGDSMDALEGFQGGSTGIPPHSYALIIDPGFAYDFAFPNGTILLTTPDASIGNGLSADDPVRLLESDTATTPIDSFGDGSFTASDAGDGISWEKLNYTTGDDTGNWQKSDATCANNMSPGRKNPGAGGLCGELVINEIMANPLVEDTGEFIELYNVGNTDIELAGLMFSDGNQLDTVMAYMGGSTVLPAGEIALIIDPEFANDYDLSSASIVVTPSNSHLGNGLSVSDEVTLWDVDGTSLLDQFLFPSNPGNGVSIERFEAVLLDELDSDANWRASTCASGSSPGLFNCASTTTAPGSVSDWDVIITEIMANPLDEQTGEYVEIYNAGTDPVDLLYTVIWDGDAVDTCLGYFSPLGDATLNPGEYALIVDAQYAGQYDSDIPAGTLIMTTDDLTIASGLANNDPIFFYEAGALLEVDSYSYPLNAGNGNSVERVDIAVGDESSNWRSAACGPTPGAANCP